MPTRRVRAVVAVINSMPHLSQCGAKGEKTRLELEAKTKEACSSDLAGGGVVGFGSDLTW